MSVQRVGPDRPTAPTDEEFVRRARRFFEPLLRYHHFRTVGTEHLPREGAFLLIVHHTLATYDGFLLAAAVWDATGRIPRGLGDDRIFDIPWLGNAARRLGIVPASPEAGRKILDEGHILGVAPGGMWESLRPKQERRTSRWGDRRGFVRLAIQAGVPVVLGACPAGDDIYRVYRSRLTDAVYRRTHLPFPIARGIGPTALPRPVHLTAYFSEPIQPPVWAPAREAEQVDAFHAGLTSRMRALLQSG